MEMFVAPIYLYILYNINNNWFVIGNPRFMQNEHFCNIDGHDTPRIGQYREFHRHFTISRIVNYICGIKKVTIAPKVS